MNNRQNGRRRGRNNQRPQGQGRNHDSGNRIDSRARGNAAQLLEKYRNMARDAQLSGDRVMTEYYLQFADHYFRVLSDARSRQEEQRARFDDRDDGRGEDQDGNVDDADDTLDPIESIGRAPRRRDREERRDYAPQNDAQQHQYGDDASADSDQGGREPRADRGNRDGNRDAGREGGRDGNRRNDRRDDFQQRRPRRERANGNAADHQDDEPAGIDIAVLPPAIGAEAAAPEPAAVDDATSAEDAPAPKRRGRPRKVSSEATA